MSTPYHWYDAPDNLLLQALVQSAGGGGQVADHSYALLARTGAGESVTYGFDLTTDVSITGAAFDVDTSPGWLGGDWPSPTLRVTQPGIYTVSWYVNVAPPEGQTTDLSPIIHYLNDAGHDATPFNGLVLGTRGTTPLPASTIATHTAWLPASTHIYFDLDVTDPGYVTQQAAVVQRLGG